MVRSGQTVHTVSLGEWIGEEIVPELLCRTGVAGWSPTVPEPARAEVSCARCLRQLGGVRTHRAAALVRRELTVLRPLADVHTQIGNSAELVA
ncbi:hypothetical protein DFR70_103667 [Nocardia tenerifensis]|uniref:Uncharacterized protein n=1 Tax=Nocardia tenerifensis TaxID=228006 RepID=A0A318K9H8_9NOCA|nr:hypothetical protein [Nocardia tenerifensis]PXX66912.1 hypothetical protein DFR70_103667 [Nocardia tenerifensis]